MFVLPTKSMSAATGVFAMPESTASPFQRPMMRGRPILIDRMRRVMETHTSSDPPSSRMSDSARPVRRAFDPRLLEGSITRSLFLLAVPIMGANILQVAYQVIDAFWVGRLGAA